MAQKDGTAKPGVLVVNFIPADVEFGGKAEQFEATQI